VLAGFTLTNGSAGFGGGVYCESANAVVTNCVLSGNSAWNEGGGAYGGTLNNCTLTGNSGGGAYGGTLNNCALTGNSAWNEGGGAYNCTLNNCALTGNSAWNEGGGAYNCTLNNCALTGNWATYGGGAYDCTLNNCTLTGNSGGGALSSKLNNCIVYFNDGGNYDPSSTLNYCCTTPLPTNGVGNISADPQLADTEHLSAGSPCRGAGSTAYASGTDVDGEPWANPPSIGCDEFHASAMNGPLSVAILADYTNVVPGFAVSFTAQITGHASASIWDFGDGTVVSNLPYASHAWTATGDYTVVLHAYNNTYPGGVAASLTVHVTAQLVYYVALNSTSPQAPYSSWATAATNIQDTVDVAAAGATIFVTNGTYAGGSRVSQYGVTNRVVVDKPLVLRSVNGPDVTIVNGGGTARCLYLTNNVVMVGFTLTKGLGGVYCESTSAVLSNCVLTGNSAQGGSGGGAYGGTLNNCALTGNSGGGAYGGTLNNCTVTGNSGWGASSATLNNCIVYFNSDPNGGNYDASSILNYCCTTPLPTSGVGNISAEPQLASASHLSAESPCIGAGSAKYANGTDIDGEAWANPPSMGCDEYHAGAVTGPLTVSLTAT
jgi:hypothetical protein